MRRSHTDPIFSILAILSFGGNTAGTTDIRVSNLTMYGEKDIDPLWIRSGPHSDPIPIPLLSG